MAGVFYDGENVFLLQERIVGQNFIVACTIGAKSENIGNQIRPLASKTAPVTPADHQLRTQFCGTSETTSGVGSAKRMPVASASLESANA